MLARIEDKPTAHKNRCLICEKLLIKGELTVYIEQRMYPGINTGRICMNCIFKKIQEKLQISNKGDKKRKIVEIVNIFMKNLILIFKIVMLMKMKNIGLLKNQMMNVHHLNRG